MSDDLDPPDRSNTWWALFWREQQAAQLTPGDVDMFVAYERERRWARRRLALAVGAAATRASGGRGGDSR